MARAASGQVVAGVAVPVDRAGPAVDRVVAELSLARADQEDSADGAASADPAAVRADAVALADAAQDAVVPWAARAWHRSAMRGAIAACNSTATHLSRSTTRHGMHAATRSTA